VGQTEKNGVQYLIYDEQEHDLGVNINSSHLEQSIANYPAQAYFEAKRRWGAVADFRITFQCYINSWENTKTIDAGDDKYNSSDWFDIPINTTKIRIYRHEGSLSRWVRNIKVRMAPHIRINNLMHNDLGEVLIGETKSIEIDFKSFLTSGNLNVTTDNPNFLINGKDTKIDNDLKFALPQGDSKCEILLTLRGCGKLLFAPGAQTSSIAITGNWESPGFTGDILPETREISNGNFSAQWNIGKFNAAVGHAGVELCIPAGSYQQVERCFTYATFFLIVFFFTLLAAELITKIYIHAVQYVVAAGAPVLFYLMTLAFSERAGFTAGYIISAAVIVTMVTMYARMFLRRTLPALTVGTIFAASYLLNFIILRLEDLALISGTIVLAIILGTVMSLTGKLNRKTSDDGTL
jgi:inner membrane protein involved in colicin E2 resistance